MKAEVSSQFIIFGSRARLAWVLYEQNGGSQVALGLCARRSELCSQLHLSTSVILKVIL